MYGQAAEST